MASPSSPPRLPMARPVPEDDLDSLPEAIVCAEDEPQLAAGTLARVRSGFEWCFGFCSLLLGLAALAAVPLLQFLTLGYLLEASGRIARSGRLRDGFIGIRTAAHLGGIAVGSFVLWLPLYGASFMAERARLIAPHGAIARQWETALAILAVLYVLHTTAALLRGGRLRSFFQPLNSLWLARQCFRENVVRRMRDDLWRNVAGLRLPYYFWLGFRGYMGAFLWLFVPLVLLSQGHQTPASGVLGGMLLCGVVVYLPMLQTRFARDNRFGAFWELSAVRADFRHAPVVFGAALALHLLLAMPLYVLKIEVIPRDLVFLEGLVFLFFVFPARWLDGWADARAMRPGPPRHSLWRWMGRLAVLPVAAAYVLVVFLSQHLSWHGVSSLYEQHAFLLPVPFTKW